jgi:hypothetical protein
MKDGLKKQMTDKAIGLNYETGLSMDQTGDGVEEQNLKKKRYCVMFVRLPRIKLEEARSTNILVVTMS